VLWPRSVLREPQDERDRAFFDGGGLSLVATLGPSLSGPVCESLLDGTAAGRAGRGVVRWWRVGRPPLGFAQDRLRVARTEVCVRCALANYTSLVRVNVRREP